MDNPAIKNPPAIGGRFNYHPCNGRLVFSAIGQKEKSMPVLLAELATGSEAPGFMPESFFHKF
jgi:hypothetical protein